MTYETAEGLGSGSLMYRPNSQQCLAKAPLDLSHANIMSSLYLNQKAILSSLSVSEVGKRHGRTDGRTDNMQFLVWHGSQNLCQTMIEKQLSIFLSLQKVFNNAVGGASHTGLQEEQWTSSFLQVRLLHPVSVHHHLTLCHIQGILWWVRNSVMTDCANIGAFISVRFVCFGCRLHIQVNTCSIWSCLWVERSWF